MKEFQDRRRVRRLLHSRYAIIALVLLCLLLGKAVWSVHDKYEKSQALADKANRDLAELQSRQESLSSKSRSLGTDQGTEREIRDRFGLVKAGEEMVIIVDDKPGDDGITPAPPRAFWQRFLDLFR